MALLFILFAAPSWIKDSTHRIINNDKHFEKDAPFHFTLNNQDLDVVQYEDFLISVEVDGEALPDEVFVDVDNFQYRMRKENANTFTYTFKNVQKDIPFEFFSGSVRSDDHQLNVLMKPKLTNFDLYLNYPSYTSRKDESLSNIGDVLVPQGTTITWNFDAENTDAVDLKFASDSKVYNAERKAENRFGISKRLMKDDLYKVLYSNELIPTPDSVTYAINVSPDQYPEIRVETFQDSIENGLVYFIGNASDDYGLSSVSFNYSITKANGSKSTQKEVLLNPSSREVQYDYTLDIDELELKPGDKVSYFFETADNDAVNGSKTAKTSVMEFEKPTVEEFEEQEDQNEEDIKDKLEEALKESKKIKEDLQKLREKMLQKQEPDWEDKKEVGEVDGASERVRREDERGEGEV